jgi:hypothetical protein
MMPQDFRQNSPISVLTEPVVVVAWPSAQNAFGSPQDVLQDVPQDVALASVIRTLTSAVQDLTDNLQALQARRPPASHLNDTRSWTSTSHRPERLPRPSRVPSRSRGPHP